MLSLLLILSGLGRLTPVGQRFEAPLLQITMPQKIETNTNRDDVSETHVAYLINIEEKTYTFLLEKQSFLHPHFLVYLYSKSGTLYPDSSFKKGHCFYQGYAAEIPKSIATLNICSGLRGLLHLENITYGIKPLEMSPAYEHMLYQIKDNTINDFPLQENYFMSQYVDKSYDILFKSEKNSGDTLLKRVLKVQIIMDKAMYDYMGSEVEVAVEKVIQIFGLINTMFSQLKMTIMLSSLELWSDKSKISTSGDADEVLQRFLSWKQFSLHRFNDMAYLLIYRENSTSMGATYHGTACDPTFATGVALHSKMITLEAFSVVMAQLLGTNLGLTFDNNHGCYCQGTACIMNPEAILSHGVKYFSSCSIDEFKQIIFHPKFECLLNKTISRVISPKQLGACGNTVLEEGEECDCGSKEACTHKKCCHPDNCTLTKGSECGTGKCCNEKTCKMHLRGQLCRQSRDVCDFAEYCNGTSEFCGPDFQAADLEPCNNRTAYCRLGVCQDLDRQCVELFGKFAKGGHYLCSEEINLQFDKFGNCHGLCNYKYVLCGKLTCHWTRADLVKIKDHDIQYTYLDNLVCLSAHLKNTSRKDLTYVADGTICEQHKVCKDTKCKDIDELRDKSLCDSEIKCQGHGVCNNAFNCQCDPGYAPPKCDLAPSSQGGSVDDGNWLITERKMPLFVEQHVAPHKNGLLISFYVFLPFLILTAIVILKWNKMKGFWHREETMSIRSSSEVSSGKSNQSQN
ncbi:A disintegrin and metallopeptidase domain 3-like [Otolemur garnettii]|uniref:A disintegrin and metallopeptidase domain 3-like n=1 Tax=Otolemur garnettii TaxID=30611 RepID=UPI0002742858|nr:A disintegrin and metallopeptidase domain 3-like [Otolemur garnettii]